MGDTMTEEELAAEWLFYATRFGIVAEISNGRYTDEQCKLVATAAAEAARLRADRETSQRRIDELTSELELARGMIAAWQKADAGLVGRAEAEAVKRIAGWLRSIDAVDAWAADTAYGDEQVLAWTAAQVTARAWKGGAMIVRLEMFTAGQGRAEAVTTERR